MNKPATHRTFWLLVGFEGLDCNKIFEFPALDLASALADIRETYAQEPILRSYQVKG